jgi:hypothetical protein
MIIPLIYTSRFSHTKLTKFRNRYFSVLQEYLVKYWKRLRKQELKHLPC